MTIAKQDLTVVDTWHSMGMRGTDSQMILGLEPDFPLATFGPIANGE